MRLIDGDALKRKLQKVATEAWKMKLNASIEKTFNQCMDYIDTAPTIEPKQGEWNPYYTERAHNDIFNCRLCGHTFIVIQGKEDMKFCPNCGAHMKGITDE